MHIRVLLEKKQYGVADLYIPDGHLEGKSSNSRKRFINQAIKDAFENNNLKVRWEDTMEDPEIDYLKMVPDREQQEEFLTDYFFDLMRRDSYIVSPYNEDKNYAYDIALEYLNEHPDFTTPPRDTNGCYIYNDTMLEELDRYCEDKCEALGYDGSDLENDDM